MIAVMVWLGTNVMSITHPTARGQGGAILLVEDEPSVQELTEMALQRCGFRVMSVSDGSEALSVFNVHEHAISMVLTNLFLPGLDGATLVRAIQSKNAGVPIVITSGKCQEDALDELKGLEISAFLSKPFTVAELTRTVSDASAHRNAQRLGGLLPAPVAGFG